MNLNQVLGGIGAGLSGTAEGIDVGTNIALKRQEMQVRKQQMEIETYNGLQNALRIPDKKMRGYILERMLPRIGLDPKSDEGAGFIKALNGSEDETIKAVSDALSKAHLDGLPPELLGQTIRQNPGAAVEMILKSAEYTRQNEQVKDIFAGGAPQLTTDKTAATRVINDLEVSRLRAIAAGRMDIATQIQQQQELQRKMGRVGFREMGAPGSGQKTVTIKYTDKNGNVVVKQVPKGVGDTVISDAAVKPTKGPSMADIVVALGKREQLDSTDTGVPWIDKLSRTQAQALLNRYKSVGLQGQVMQEDYGATAGQGTMGAPGNPTDTNSGDTVDLGGSDVTVVPGQEENPNMDWYNQYIQNYQQEQ